MRRRVCRPGMMAHAYNTSTLKGSLEPRSSRPAWPTWRKKPCLYKKYKKVSRAWWHAPVVPATREAEAEESLEPRRWRLQWAEITPLHSSLLTEQDSVSKKKKRKYRQVKSDQQEMEAKEGSSHDCPSAFIHLSLLCFFKISFNSYIILWVT